MEIRLQNEQLVERNAELDMLMAITAHDVRSPLFGLRNLFDLTIRRAAKQPDLPLEVLRQAECGNFGSQATRRARVTVAASAMSWNERRRS
ncbi:hypothetical protein GCM10007973_10780 [Polymorphobacter multimanifer]|uniref:Light-regulated signal transduction histidine kinase (Bacteriophytochrome) n=1 Tax=Polymorphobacter multimanifer TaxID=1070431 RepID=A0A841LF06_9SPHN|nr:hypothetical protein [Polymorphobacter multimanifer]MBB6228395.1 light-regulated signal transduction histidine kinase (bacteriophytochrome) [Polymorphobacter multimanifer]GGI75681.1 hypothetical protein GCM10007973_10780 [Polymorphobacter multimanifer]